MKKQENKSRQFWTLLIVILVCVFIAGFTVGFSNQKYQNKIEHISEVLEETCSCQEVNQLIYAKGIQFGKEGVTTEKADYELVDCEFSASSKKELIRLNKLLKQKVKGYESIDLLELKFINNNLEELVVIKNGEIQ